MADKILKTRIQLKYDTLAAWNSLPDTKKLKAGEVAVVAIPEDTTTTTDANGKVVTQITPPTVLFKVGDGEKTFKELPWLSGLAADVHSWAKKTEAEFKKFVQEDCELATAGQLDAIATRVKTLEDTIADINTALDADFVTEDEFSEFKATNTQAIADAKKAGTDANTALETYKDANDEAVDNLSTAFATFRDTTAPDTYAAKSVETTKADKDSVYAKTETYSKTEVDGLIEDVEELITGTDGLDARVDALETFKANTAATKQNVEDAKSTLIGTANDESSADTINAAKKYADEKVAALVDGAPAALDTLDELAAALKDNADIVTVLEQAIGDKAAQDDLDGHTSNKNNPHKVTAAQVGAYTKEEVDAIIAPIPNTDTTYTFADGTEGKFTVTPKDGEAIEVDTGAKDYVDGIKDDLDARIVELEKVDHAHTSSLDDIEDAVDKKHEHTNKDVLDGITAEKVTAWDNAEGKAKEYADGLDDAMDARVAAIEADYIRAEVTKVSGQPDSMKMFIGNGEDSEEITLIISGGSASDVW